MDVKFKKEYNDLKRSGNRNAGVLSSNEWYSAQAFRGKKKIVLLSMSNMQD